MKESSGPVLGATVSIERRQQARYAFIEARDKVGWPLFHLFQIEQHHYQPVAVDGPVVGAVCYPHLQYSHGKKFKYTTKFLYQWTAGKLRQIFPLKTTVRCPKMGKSLRFDPVDVPTVENLFPCMIVGGKRLQASS
jgi:hypothetical protein